MESISCGVFVCNQCKSSRKDIPTVAEAFLYGYARVYVRKFLPQNIDRVWYTLIYCLLTMKRGKYGKI